VDLNDRLTKDIFEGVMAKWNKTVNISVPSRLSQLVEDIAKDFDVMLKDICSDTPEVLAIDMDAFRSFGIRSRLEDSCENLRNIMLTAQRIASRAPKDTMQKKLSVHYQVVGRQTGLGLFEKMKNMNNQHMVDHADELYNAVSEDIRNMFSNLVDDMEAEMARSLIRLNKLLLSLLKSKREKLSGDPERVWSIIDWAEKVHPSIKHLLYSVEERLSEISNEGCSSPLSCVNSS